jgi:hypothetical protein
MSSIVFGSVPQSIQKDRKIIQTPFTKKGIRLEGQGTLVQPPLHLKFFHQSSPINPYLGSQPAAGLQFMSRSSPAL